MGLPLRHNWGESLAADRTMAKLSGLSPRLWGRRRLMNLQAFIDESEDGEYFVLAGYAASPARWRDFSIEWERRLRYAKLGPNNVRRFKMNEMAAGRMDDVVTFYRVIEEFAELAVSVVFKPAYLTSALHRITFPGKLITWGGWSNPYLLGFRVLTDIINRRRDDISQVLRPNEKIDFIFDERRVEKENIVRVWDRIIEQLPMEHAVLYGNTPSFENDEEYLPLQAADFWAWWVRRWAIQYPESHISGEFPWNYNREKPPRLMITFSEEGLIDYLVAETANILPSGTSFNILPASQD